MLGRSSVFDGRQSLKFSNTTSRTQRKRDCVVLLPLDHFYTLLFRNYLTVSLRYLRKNPVSLCFKCKDFNNFFFYLSASQRPDAPQGNTKPFDFTLRPISSEITCPPNFDFTSVEIR